MAAFYARHRSIDKKLHLAISKEKRHTFRCFNRWRTAILSSFGYDPLICPHCKQQMVILEIYHNHRRVPLEELYEKAMSRSRGKRSSDDHFFLCYNPSYKGRNPTMKKNIKELREKYISNPQKV